MKKLTLADFQLMPVDTVAPKTGLEMLVKLFDQQKSDCVAVCQNLTPIGIYTKEDVFWLTARNPPLNLFTAADFMNPSVFSLPVNTSATEALATFNKHQLDLLLVINESGIIDGALTRDSLESNRPESPFKPPDFTPEHFQFLVTHCPLGIYKLNATGHCIYINPWGMEKLGMGDETLLTVDWLNLVHTDDKDRVFQKRHKALLNKEPYQMEYRIQQANGNISWMLDKAVYLKDMDNRVFGHLGTLTDITEHKQNEERLTLSQAYGGIGTWEADLVHNTQLWSAECVNLLGFPIHSQPTWDDFIEAIHPDDRSNVIRATEAHLQSGVDYEVEYRIISQLTGEERWLRSRGHAEYNEQKKPVRIRGIVQDITELHELIEAFKRSENQLKKAQRLAQIGNWELNHINGTLYWSDEVFSIFELDPSQFQPDYQSFLKQVHPDDRRQVDDSFASSLVNKESYSLDHRVIMPDGAMKYVHETCETLYDPSGQPLRSLGTVQDITNRKLVEAQNQYFFDTLNASLNELYIFDEQLLTFEFVSQGALNNLGYSMTEMLLKTPLDLKPDFSHESFTDLIQPLRNNELNVLHFETFHLRADGSSYPVEVHLQIIERVDHKVFLAVILDVTERKEAEAALRQFNEALEARVQERTQQLQVLNQELETFTYTVSHDLKAPLRGIDGYSRLLQEECATLLDAEGRQFIENIRFGVGQMSELIEDLLSYSRLERRRLAASEVNLTTLIQRLCTEMQSELKKSKALVKLDIPEEMTVFADQDGMMLVLRNLLDNALKFSLNACPPAIEIGAEKHNKHCLLWVRDNGIGFDMKFHDRIFEIFQRLQRAEDYPGTGIGLSIVKKALQRMNGRVWAKSKPGQGATFYLELSQCKTKT